MTKRVCRACFQILSEEDCVPRSKNSGFVEQQTVEDVLKNVIPEMVVGFRVININYFSYFFKGCFA